MRAKMAITIGPNYALLLGHLGLRMNTQKIIDTRTLHTCKWDAQALARLENHAQIIGYSGKQVHELRRRAMHAPPPPAPDTFIDKAPALKISCSILLI